MRISVPAAVNAALAVKAHANDRKALREPATALTPDCGVASTRAEKSQRLWETAALDTAASVKKLVAFYVEQHNSHLPHSAFKGQTPDEMYFGTGDGIPKKLEEEKFKARELRLKSNRERNCHVCSLSASVGC